MSDFWSNTLRNARPQPVEVQQPEIPWWQRVVDVPIPAAGQPVSPADEPGPVDPVASQARTQWSRDGSGACPNCSSGNYVKHPESPTASRPRCFDCGYPLTQSGSGLGSLQQPRSSAPVKAARQTQESKTNNFDPRNIVQHI